ncbi:MAG TPA: PIG-L deacetylase family protein [Candidatus Saccharimonadia bacterium]|nr:PIG-L deacetylase family protein [Candidatus Saccharimonadia bacterium]
MTRTYSKLDPAVVLGVAAHADDLDYYAGGSMAVFAEQGAKVYYLILTDGSKGSSDRTMTPERLRDIRREEQRSAAKVLGITDVFFCDYSDGMLENTAQVKKDIARVIRQVKSDTVVTLDPAVLYLPEQGLINHPDHRAAGQAVLDAVYPLARDHMSFPELLADGYEPHAVKTVLLACFDPEAATFAVDISATIERKLQALGAHASQLSVQEMKQTLHASAAKAAARYGCAYAEPFIRIDVD